MLAHCIIVQAPVCSYVTDNLMQPTLQVGFDCLSRGLAELPASVLAVAVLVLLPSKNLGTNLKPVKQLLHEIPSPTQAYNGKTKNNGKIKTSCAYFTTRLSGFTAKASPQQDVVGCIERSLRHTFAIVIKSSCIKTTMSGKPTAGITTIVEMLCFVHRSVYKYLQGLKGTGFSNLRTRAVTNSQPVTAHVPSG